MKHPLARQSLKCCKCGYDIGFHFFKPAPDNRTQYFANCPNIKCGKVRKVNLKSN